MDRSELGDFYRVCRYLNEPKRILGCTADEFYPAAIFLLSGLIVASMLLGMLVASIWVFCLKMMKKKYGQAFILVGIYWYFPTTIAKRFFPSTPASDYKFWLS